MQKNAVQQQKEKCDAHGSHRVGDHLPPRLVILQEPSAEQTIAGDGSRANRLW